MALARVRHARVQQRPDVPSEPDLLQPSDWNADHELEFSAVRLPAGRWIGVERRGGVGAGQAVAGTGALMVAPLELPGEVRVDRVGVEVLVGAAGELVQLVLFEAAAGGALGAMLGGLLLPADAAGVAEGAFPLELSAGLYWLGAWIGAGVLVRGVVESACQGLGYAGPADTRQAVALVLPVALDDVAAAAGQVAQWSALPPPAVRLRVA